MTYRPDRRHHLDLLDRAHDLVPWRQAAELLQVKPRTLARWIDRGLLPYTLLDGRRYVAMADASQVEADTRKAGKRP